MRALSLLSGDPDPVVAIPVGRGWVCKQSFDADRYDSEPELINDDALFGVISSVGSKLVLHGSIFDTGRFPLAINAGWNMAWHLCAAADSRYISSELRPFFVDRKIGNI